MKTNFQILTELLKIYKPKRYHIVSPDEKQLIENTLHLSEMTLLELNNLRDFVVCYMSQNKSDAIWDKMSAITFVIDTKIIGEYKNE